MIVSLTLMLIGTDEEPRWACDARPGGGSSPRWNRCCEQGHKTPEAAASHGTAEAVALLARDARALKPPAAGALAIQKLEAAA
jgi:hypothetical protein